MRSTFISVIIIIVCTAVLFTTGCDRNGKDDRLTIAVIPKGSTHEFWKAIHAGALNASQETGVDIIWKDPAKEDDREEQIQTVESFIAAGVDAIVLAPLDDRELLMLVREAKAVGILDQSRRGFYHDNTVALLRDRCPFR